MPITIHLKTGEFVKTIGKMPMPVSTGKPVMNDWAPPTVEPANDHAPPAESEAAAPPGLPVPATPPKTLGDLKRHLEHLASLGHAKDVGLMISAINSVTRKFPGTTPDDHSCSPAQLRQRLASVPCAEKDKATWSSIRSRLLHALQISGLDVMPGKRKHKLPPAWQDLLDKLPANTWSAALSRFFGFCAGREFEPDQMCDGVAKRFLFALEETSLRGRPMDIYRGAIRGWNSGADSVPDWPQIRLTLPEFSSERSVFYTEEFTPAFQSALKAHLAYLADPPDEDDDAPLKACAPATLKARDFYIRQIASALIHQGIRREDVNSLSDLVSKEKLDLLCAYLNARHGKLATPAARSLLEVFRSLARYQAKNSLLAKKIGKRLKAKVISKLPPIGMTEKNRKRIAQFKRPELVRQYLLAPLVLRQKALACTKNRRRAAVMMRAAVVLELEMMCPIRLNNLVGLTLGKHLLPYTNGKKSTGMRLFIPGEQVKNGENIDMELPETLVRLIEEYLQDYRKALIKPEFQHTQPIHLFPNPEGQVKSGKVLAQIVCDALKAELGIAFNFHLFRHIGCYLYLKRRPGDFETMRRVLAHRNLETTARFYAEMEKEEAFRTFDLVMLELRESQQWRPPKPKTPMKAAKIMKIMKATNPKPKDIVDVL